MVISASGHEKLFLVWLVLQFASTGVVDHAGIKVPYFTFFGHDSGIRAKEPPLNMLLAMGLAAFLCVFIGVFPQPLYNLLPFPVNYEPYTGSHVIGQLQLLMFGAFAFTLLILSGYYVPEIKARNLDADWTYRMLARAAYRFLDTRLNAMNRWCETRLMAWVKAISNFFRGLPAGIALFVAVNAWLAAGFRDKRLEIKKHRLYNDIAEGTLPIGFGAAVAISFIVLVFMFT
jgi:multicomponent Na+:H+ antiporter subunit D